MFEAQHSVFFLVIYVYTLVADEKKYQGWKLPDIDPGPSHSFEEPSLIDHVFWSVAIVNMLGQGVGEEILNSELSFP